MLDSGHGAFVDLSQERLQSLPLVFQHPSFATPTHTNRQKHGLPRMRRFSFSPASHERCLINKMRQNRTSAVDQSARLVSGTPANHAAVVYRRLRPRPFKAQRAHSCNVVEGGPGEEVRVDCWDILGVCILYSGLVFYI